MRDHDDECHCGCQDEPARRSVDPVCLFHGLRRSEHRCLYCQLCFKTLTPDECWEDPAGQKWDVCVPCRTAEIQAGSLGQALGA